MIDRESIHRGVMLMLLAAVAVGGSGCANHLAFATSTTFGLDVSQRADQTVDVVMGYQRAEIASIPVSEEKGSSKDHDSYSVLGTFNVDYKWNPFADGALHLTQVFSTGKAARLAAKQLDSQRYFANKVKEIAEKRKAREKEKKEKKRRRADDGAGTRDDGRSDGRGGR